MKITLGSLSENPAEDNVNFNAEENLNAAELDANGAWTWSPNELANFAAAPVGGAMGPQAKFDAGADNLNLGGGAAQGGHDALNLDLGVLHHNIQGIDLNAPAGKMDVLNAGQAGGIVLGKADGIGVLEIPINPHQDLGADLIIAGKTLTLEGFSPRVTSIDEQEKGYVPGLALVDSQPLGLSPTLIGFAKVKSVDPIKFLHFITDTLDESDVVDNESPTITIINPDDAIKETLKEVRLPYRDTEKSIKILFVQEVPYAIHTMFPHELELSYREELAKQKHITWIKNIFSNISPTHDAPKIKGSEGERDKLKTGIWDLPRGNPESGQILEKILSYLKPGDIVSHKDKYLQPIEELEGHTEVDQMIAASSSDAAGPLEVQETSTLALLGLDDDYGDGGAPATW